MTATRTTPVATPATQPVNPSHSSPESLTTSQIAFGHASSIPILGNTMSLPGGRTEADIWDWHTFSAREWRDMSAARYEEFVAFPVVLSEHWQHGHTYIVPPDAAQQLPEPESTLTTTTATMIGSNGIATIQGD